MSRPVSVGNGFVRDACRFLAESIPGVEPRTMGGTRDRGDIAGLDADGWTVEGKRNGAKLELAQAMKEAETEAGHAGTPWFVTLHWNRGRGIRNAFTTMPLWVWRDVLVEIRRLRTRVAELEAVIREFQ